MVLAGCEGKIVSVVPGALSKRNDSSGQRIFLFFSFIEFKFGSDIFEKLNSIKGRIKDPAKVIVHMSKRPVVLLSPALILL